MKQLATAILLCFFAYSNDCLAQEAAPITADEQTEIRLISISNNLRCLVCQNESLVESKTELAQDLRREIREQIKSGKTDGEVLDFMVSSYGDFVLHQQKLKTMTLLLWLSSGLLLLAGIGALFWYLRHRRKSHAQDHPLPRLAYSATLDDKHARKEEN